ncbi:MAG: cytochrome ubiquinol oxidase subunit I [Thermoanaerobaculia bacterium]|nr:cytochrome ubiquinol oxidase subunit I [Thermoanaerobaculia bacterium]
MDVVFLSRLQFAFTIMFHYIFPPLTIGLSLVIVYLLAMHVRTREAIYDRAARFWTKIFGLNFAIGVATGIVMEFQFGTNWAIYSRYVGDVFGSALAAEGIFAFFLESGFLAILLFGWDRVSPRFHLFSAAMVSLGAIFSSVWITVANSWQQTPAGFVLREHTVGERTFMRAEITDFWAMVFNPSSIHRLVHVWFGAFILGAFFVMSISAWYILRKKHEEFARRSFRGALVMGTIFSIAQLVSGDLQAINVAEHQPAKLAAFEGLYETQDRAPLYLFGWPDDGEQRVRYGMAVPGLLSFLIHRDVNAEVPGLLDLEADWGRPPVWMSFQSYHLMVAIGMLFIASSLISVWFLWRGTLFEKSWLMWYHVVAVVAAFAANQLGWVAAEVGRQPWIVYPVEVGGVITGGLRTADGISEVVSSAQVLGSIIMFGLIYALLFVIWVWVLNNKIQHGPDPVSPEPDRTSAEDFLDTASRRPGHEDSMTEAKTAPEPNAT